MSFKDYLACLALQVTCLLSKIFNPSTVKTGVNSQIGSGMLLFALGIFAATTVSLVGMGVAEQVFTSSVRSKATAESLTLYYTAQAGIQEALATRMYPRSNYLSFSNPASALYPFSGKLYQDPVNRVGLIGIYRYEVIGGQAGRNTTTGIYYATTQPGELLRPYAQQPYFVLSKGHVCRDSKGEILVDALVSTASVPTCSSGTLGTLMLSAEIYLQGNGNNRLTNQMQVDGDTAPLSSPTILPTSAVPANSVNFETIWGVNDNADLVRFVLYPGSGNSITLARDVSGTSWSEAVAGGNFSFPGNVFRFFFNRPIKPNSVSVNGVACEVLYPSLNEAICSQAATPVAPTVNADGTISPNCLTESGCPVHYINVAITYTSIDGITKTTTLSFGNSACICCDCCSFCDGSCCPPPPPPSGGGGGHCPTCPPPTAEDMAAAAAREEWYKAENLSFPGHFPSGCPK